MPPIISEKLLQNPGALCNMVKRVAIGAGHLTLEYFDVGDIADITEKEDGSPVTLADHASEKFIIEGLHGITPDIPVIAEESAQGGNVPEFEKGEYFWLVDPLDATKEFIAGGSDYTVNIALIKGTSPILGVVYAPARGVLYAGHGEGTAMRWNEETDKEKKIEVRCTPAAGLTVMASLRHNDETKFEKFLEEFKIEKIIKKASSLKICAIAEGKADMYPRLAPTCEWDTAAGEAVLRSAGGFLTNMKGGPMVYGDRQSKFLNPQFVACAFEWWVREEES